MSTEHTQCSGNNTILPKQNVSKFPRRTLTEWGESAKITNCIILSCKESRNIFGANLPANVRASSFLPKYMVTMLCAYVFQLDTIYGCQWAPTFVQPSSRPLPSFTKWQLVKHTIVPCGFVESCKGISLRLSSRPSLFQAGCVPHSVSSSGTARLLDIPAGLAESLMMNSPIATNATLYRKTKNTRLSTYTRARTIPFHSHTIGCGPTPYLIT